MMSDDTRYAAYENLASELRRGVLVLAVLAQCGEVQYGYSLKQQLSAAGLEINEGTLYPLLRRLEGQGLLGSEWLVTEERPRRYYKLSPAGVAVLEKLAAEWQELVAVVARVLPAAHTPGAQTSASAPGAQTSPSAPGAQTSASAPGAQTSASAQLQGRDT